jgi:2-polyprenyl-3-methyl-5-hydroxy-6-metoxy-1,4-benzoquinol methylase
MDLDKLQRAAERPPHYEPGDSVMWTDPHVSKKLLELHLNPELDSASRSQQSINKTLEFIRSSLPEPGMNILDLGCGPGLYLEKLAEWGHICTGVDFSENSIAYAIHQAEAKGLNIQYLCQNYLELDFKNTFDLIILIYTDIGVLLPGERIHLMDRIYEALNPGGMFVFDVLNDRNTDQKFVEDQTWSHKFSGFWSASPYLELVSGFHYPEKKVFLKQHTVIDESDSIRNYRFWMHYFEDEEMIALLKARGFKRTDSFENILPVNDIWDGENVTFYRTFK